MDFGDPGSDPGGEQKPRTLPLDLPKSLDDRRHTAAENYVPETELYDGWQGKWRTPMFWTRLG